MKNIKNIFGEGVIYDETEFKWGNELTLILQ